MVLPRRQMLPLVDVKQLVAEAKEQVDRLELAEKSYPAPRRDA
jgi:hypothetical protein